jgi:hypothetical protein
MKNDVWDTVMRLEGNFVVTSKWNSKIKHVSYGSIENYKVRFVVIGLSQKGVDYEETFSLVASYTSIRDIISHASFMGWRIHHMDVEKTLLNGVIE